MPKLAIYVPKKDVKEIEKWRKKINFSKVFMQALTREIARQSRVVKADDQQLAAAAKFYRQALGSQSAPLEEFGFQLGRGQVLGCRLSPEQIGQFVSAHESGSLTDPEFAEAIAEDEAQIAEFAAQHGYDEVTHPGWRESVYRGYREGVVAAWSQVRQAMQND